MALGDRIKDPYPAFKFLVEIKGLVVGGFAEVSGLQIEVEVQTYQEGGLNEYEHKLAGPTRYPSNLVLKRGLVDADTLWSWHQDVMRGVITRRNGSIMLLDQAGEEQWRWNFVEAYPVRWVGPELRADTAAVAIETLELVHRGLTKGEKRG
jgi:phage tail-like protein